MAETKDLGRLYVHLYMYPTRQAPIVNRTCTFEVEPPYRVGRSVIARLPLSRRGLVVGWWTTRRLSGEEEALTTALGWRVQRSAGKVTERTLFDVEA